jgi:hypothetical protein
MKEVIQLTDPTADDMARILNLFRGIPGRTCSASAYLDYLDNRWRDIALFVVKEDSVIIGFTQAEAPTILNPTAAWLPFSIAGRECIHQDVQDALRLAEAWMTSKGATHWFMNSVRSGAALKKAWGVKPAKERLFSKDIKNDS